MYGSDTVPGDLHKFFSLSSWGSETGQQLSVPFYIRGYSGSQSLSDFPMVIKPLSDNLGLGTMFDWSRGKQCTMLFLELLSLSHTFSLLTQGPSHSTSVFLQREKETILWPREVGPIKEGEMKMNCMLRIAGKTHSTQNSWGAFERGDGLRDMALGQQFKGNLEKPGRSKNYSEAVWSAIQDVSQSGRANLII